MSAAVTRRPALVAMDVDGTLVERDMTLPPARVEALEALRAAGVPVVLATGKVWPSIAALWERLDLPGPHVCCSGAAVVAADERLLEVRDLDPGVADSVSGVLLGRDIAHALYLDDGTIVTPRRDDRLDILVALGEPSPVQRPRDGKRVLKVLSVVAADEEGDLRRLHADAARVQRTGPAFLEWNNPTADKGTGLRRVAAELGVDPADAVALGDAENDVPMFAVAGMAVAVGGSSAAAIRAADLHLADGDIADYLWELARDGVTRP